MKPLFLLLALLSTGTLLAQPMRPPPPEFQSMKMQATVMPTFPPTLVARGVTTGVARIAIRVDHEGRLDDWIIVGYTEEILATSALDALKRWKFTPAMLNGEPVSAQSELEFLYQATGVVVSQNAVQHFLDRLSRMGGPEMIYQPSTLKQLDRIPTPVQVVSPIYSQQMLERGLRGEVTVDFYIDEQGRVRMPVVDRGEDPELASLALQAVEQWSFAPPTRRGKPVLVQARQRFRFGLEE